MNGKLFVVVVGVAVWGCRSVGQPTAEPDAPAIKEVLPVPTPPAEIATHTVRERWNRTLAELAPLTRAGAFAAADTLLADFAVHNDGTCEAAEAGYLRALLLISPENKAAAPARALPFLDHYLASTCLQPVRAAEVALVRRMSEMLATKRAISDSLNSEEMRKLKDQLDQTKKELERLKMRVIPPKRLNRL